ncbi:MAG: PAS domain S-box protein [Spirochaetia bacterium]
MLSLIQNVAILLALIVVHDQVNRALRDRLTLSRIISGILFGGFTIVGMLTPMEFAPGVIYDGRSIILGAAGYMGGWIPAAISALISGGFRLYLGGAGALPGVLVVAESALAGTAVYYLRCRYRFWETNLGVWLFGVAIHIVMLGLQLLLPEGLGLRVLGTIGITVLAVFPVALLLIVRIFLNQREYRRVENDLAESESWYRALFEDSFAPRLIIEPETGKINDANQSAVDFYGWGLDELKAMTIFDINVLTKEEIRENMSTAREKGQNYFEFRHRTKDRGIRDVAVFSSPVSLEEKILLNSTVLDQTERKTLERELYIKDYSLENAAISAFRIRDKDGMIEWANKTACSKLGYSKEELTGMTVFDIDPTFTQESWRIHRQRMRDTGAVTIESTHRSRDGSLFPVEVTVTYLTYGGQFYSLSFAKDISARKRAEERLTESFRQKETLLHEVHHRVRNNLSLINSLILLPLDTLKSPQEAETGLRKTADRILAMGMIHNILYEHEDLSRLDFMIFLRRLTQELQRIYCGKDGCRTAVVGEVLFLDVSIAVPLGLIAGEIISGLFQHTGVRGAGGGIKISVSPAGDREYSLVIEIDSSTYVPESFKEDVHLYLSDFGLELIEILTQQIGGEAEFGRPDGILVTIRFSTSGAKEWAR